MAVTDFVLCSVCLGNASVYLCFIPLFTLARNSIDLVNSDPDKTALGFDNFRFLSRPKYLLTNKKILSNVIQLGQNEITKLKNSVDPLYVRRCG